MQIDLIKAHMQSVKNIFFIGIGGVSMASLARILTRRGYVVSGSDRSASAATAALAAEGIEVFIGHDAAHLGQSEVVVFTAAIPESNAELKAARERGLLVLTRGELLGWLMLGYEKRIGIAGTHGKSTTTSMAAMILMAAKVDPTILSGANLDAMGGAYRLGGEEYFLFEACEYKDSFLSFFPSTAVIGNVELDHVDYFGTFDRMKESFAAYLSGASVGILNADDPDCIAQADAYAGKVVTFGIDQAADYRAKAVVFTETGAMFRLVVRGKTAGTIQLRVPGRHNVLNALAAAAATMENGIDFLSVKTGLCTFGGASRRFDLKGYLHGNVPVYDDYAHHPTEIRATLGAAKEMGKRVVCLFQSHTYSRTAALFDDFVSSLSLADVLILVPIYAAREVNTFGIDETDLGAKIEGAMVASSLQKGAKMLGAQVREGDLVLLMGAGDVASVSGMLELVKKCEV